MLFLDSKQGASGAGTTGRAATAPGAGPAVGRTLAGPLGAVFRANVNVFFPLESDAGSRL